MIDNLLNKGQRDRSHISMGQPHEVQYWTRHLGVSKDELQRAVDKVGNSAAAVRKELGLLGKPHQWTARRTAKTDSHSDFQWNDPGHHSVDRRLRRGPDLTLLYSAGSQ